MFKHALESLDHGVKHYLDGSETSRKFALLHIDQAVELLLKERIVNLGKTVYKSDGKTLNFHEACNSLSKERDIPERPRLEALHDLRNSVQHKGLVPDLETTRFYVKTAFKFVKRFLHDEFDVSVGNYIERQDRALVEEQPLSSSVEKVVAAYGALCRVASFFGARSLERAEVRSTLLEVLALRGVAAQQVEPSLDTISQTWDRIAYSDHIPTEAETAVFLRAVDEILNQIGPIQVSRPPTDERAG